MNFQVTPFNSPDKVALFCSRTEAVWKTSTILHEGHQHFTRDVISVMSTESGHFLLVLHKEELQTVRDVCRSEKCDFLGIFNRNEVEGAIRESVEKQTPSTQNRSTFC